MVNKNFENNMVKLTKIFNNRPNHFIKFLIENNAFNKNFISKVDKSDNLNSFSIDMTTYDFNGFTQMEEFFNSLISESDNDRELLEQELREQLLSYVNSEKYTEAAKIRDIIKKKGLNFKL